MFGHLHVRSSGHFGGWIFLEVVMVRGFLPTSFGGLDVWQVSLHAPAAFIGSFDHSKELVSDILGRTSPTLVHLAHTLKGLASASGQNDWSSLRFCKVKFPMVLPNNY